MFLPPVVGPTECGAARFVCAREREPLPRGLVTVAAAAAKRGEAGQDRPRGWRLPTGDLWRWRTGLRWLSPLSWRLLTGVAWTPRLLLLLWLLLLLLLVVVTAAAAEVAEPGLVVVVVVEVVLLASRALCNDWMSCNTVSPSSRITLTRSPILCRSCASRSRPVSPHFEMVSSSSAAAPESSIAPIIAAPHLSECACRLRAGMSRPLRSVSIRSRERRR
mmetsp:Transcript_47622/g.114290  ORF Transcript_47622/g.114290 Transcript_47622/m.114290 type:complete len:219 (+) Transcript_47622:508-1164(+)